MYCLLDKWVFLDVDVGDIKWRETERGREGERERREAERLKDFTSIYI